MTSSQTKSMLRSGTAFIRPTALERSMGRLMRGPEGHEAATPAPSPAPAPAPSPSPSPSPTPTPSAAPAAGAEGGEGAAAAAAETSALGGAGEGAAETKGDEGKGGEGEGEGGEAKPVVPETYELTAPEGLTLDSEMVSEATPIFKDLGLSNEQASKLMPLAAKFGQRIADQFNAQIASQVAADRKGWLDTAKADKEIGGANWDKSLSQGAQALDALGFTKGSPFRDLLDSSGLGNHPEMIRAWAKVGAAIGDDTSFLRGAGGNANKRDAAETLYPDDKPKTGGQ